jgi:hypothetical protein
MHSYNTDKKLMPHGTNESFANLKWVSYLRRNLKIVSQQIYEIFLRVSICVTKQSGVAPFFSVENAYMYSHELGHYV